MDMNAYKKIKENIFTDMSPCNFIMFQICEQLSKSLPMQVVDFANYYILLKHSD